MKFRSNQPGFTAIEIAIVVVVIGIIGLLGYVVYNNQVNKTASNNTIQETSQPTTANDVESAPEVNSVEDLDKAEAVLDQTDPGSSNTSDAEQLDAELGTFQPEGDLAVRPMQKYKSIDEFLKSLDSDKRNQVDYLRDLILSTQPALQEHIKWNAPSYVLDGEDRITFNLMNKQVLVKLVFHMGAARKEDKKGTPVMEDASGLIEWNSDIRGVITFTDFKATTSSRVELKKIIHDWLLIPSEVQEAIDAI